MKLLVAVVLVLSAVDAKSFSPRKVLDEIYIDRDRRESISGNDMVVDMNEVDTFTKPDYYWYVSSGPDAHKHSPLMPLRPTMWDPFYDPMGTYDLDSFTKYFTGNPFLGQLAKYFPVGKGEYDTFHYPVPKEVVELARTTKGLKETISTLMKYYYNLPRDVKAIVNQKYDFDNVMKFLLQVYYDIPSVAHGLTTYYDIPMAVVAELMTQHDLRRVIHNIVTKYYGFGPFERDYYTRKYFDVKAVVNTLVKVYYGIPRFEYEVERYYANPEYFMSFVHGIVSRKYDGIVDSVEATLERRSRLTDTEKDYYDRFFNCDEYLKFVVRGYYHAYMESTKTPFTTSEYFKRGFHTLVAKILKYKKNFSGDEYDFVNIDGVYPLDYYFRILFGHGAGEFSNYPINYYPKGFYPYTKDFYKYFYGSYNMANTPYYRDSMYSPSMYTTSPRNLYEFVKYLNHYPQWRKYFPRDYSNFERSFGDNSGNEATTTFFDHMKRPFDFGKNEPMMYPMMHPMMYKYDLTKKPIDTTYDRWNSLRYMPSDYYEKRITGVYNDDSYKPYPIPYYNDKIVGSFSKQIMPKGYPFTFDREMKYPMINVPTYNNHFLEKYIGQRDS